MNINVLDVTKGWGPGIEASCKHIYDNVNNLIHVKTDGRVKIVKVEIWEHERNSAVYTVE